MTKIKSLHLALVAVLLSAILGGGLNPFIKIGLKEIPPMSYSFLRFLIALLVILPLFFKNKFTFKSILGIIPFSLLGTLNIILFVLGVRYTTAVASQLLYLSVPVMVSIFSFFIFKEKINTTKFFGILLGLSGALFLVFQKSSQDFSLIDNLLGNALIWLATISYVLYVIFSKKIQKIHSPVQITTSFCLTTVAVTLFFSIFEIATAVNWWNHVSIFSLTSLIYVGFLGTASYYLLQQYAVKHSNSLVSSMTLYIQPVFTYMWSSLLLGEVLTGNLLLAAAMIFIGAYLVSK